MAQTEAASVKQEVLWLNPAVAEQNRRLNIFEAISLLRSSKILRNFAPY